MHTFETRDPVELWVQLAAGRITVVADGDGRTTVDVLPEDPSDPDAVALAEQTRVHATARGRRVTVTAPRWKRSDQPALEVTIHVPEGSSLAAKTAGADVEVGGRLKDLSVKTASGVVIADDVTGRVSVDSASGRTEIATLGGTATFSTVSADATVGVANGAVRMRSASGSLSVGRSAGSLTVMTASGGLSVDAATGGTVTVRSASGDVEVGVPAGTVARLELVSHTGETWVDAPVDEAAAPALASVRIHVTTLSGDIRVHRAAGTADPAAA